MLSLSGSVATVVGSVIFVVALPVALISKSTHQTADALVVKPLGDFHSALGQYDRLGALKPYLASLPTAWRQTGSRGSSSGSDGALKRRGFRPEVIKDDGSENDSWDAHHAFCHDQAKQREPHWIADPACR